MLDNRQVGGRGRNPSVMSLPADQALGNELSLPELVPAAADSHTTESAPERESIDHRRLHPCVAAERSSRAAGRGGGCHSGGARDSLEAAAWSTQEEGSPLSASKSPLEAVVVAADEFKEDVDERRKENDRQELAWWTKQLGHEPNLSEPPPSVDNPESAPGGSQSNAAPQSRRRHGERLTKRARCGKRRTLRLRRSSGQPCRRREGYP